MSKKQWLMLLGALVILFQLPILGFPASWDAVILSIIGLLIIFTAYRISPQSPTRQNQSLPFMEHKNSASAAVRQPEVAPAMPGDPSANQITNPRGPANQ